VPDDFTPCDAFDMKRSLLLGYFNAARYFSIIIRASSIDEDEWEDYRDYSSLRIS
jgi:hypothetical protein